MSKNQDQNSNDEIVTEKEIRVIWDQEKNIPVLYANNFYVTHQGGAEFHLTFGHLIPPLIHGMEESELPDIVKITPVSKIVLSPNAIKVLINVLQSNLDKFEENKKEANND